MVCPNQVGIMPLTNSKPVPHIPLPFKEVIADVLKVKPPEKTQHKAKRKKANS
jgi:hypothetical protein